MVLAAMRADHLRPAIHLEPYAGRSPATVAQDLTYLASLGIRDVYVYHPLDFPASDWAPVTAQKPPSMRLFAGTELVGFAAAAGFNGFYTYDFMDYGGAKFARLCEQAHAQQLLCGPSVGPGYDGLRAGEFSLSRPRLDGLTYDRLWQAAIRGPARRGHDHELQRVGGRDADRAGGARGTATQSYDGSWGLHGMAAQMAYLTRTAYWAARFHSLSAR